MGKLSGKVAIVTGASRGIGRGIAIELAKEGANIVVNYSKDEEGASKVLEELKEIGVVAIGIKADVSSFKETKNLVEETVKKFGKLDILINNAGISTIGLFMDATEEDIDRMININLKGALFLSKAVLPYLLNRGGTIVNISSIWGEVGASCEVLYSTTKGGIKLFTKSLAKEMAGANIRINAIAPGVIETSMNKFLDENDRKDLEEEIPMGRFGLPEEIGKAAVFLCSDDSSYLTGETIKIDGGLI